MKRLITAVALVGPLVLAPMVPACSSSAAQDQGGDAGDAGDDQGSSTGIFEGDADDVVDEGMGTGFPEGGVIGAPTCMSSSDCPTAGDVCGFLAFAGCDAGVGQCFSFPNPPENMLGVVETACGCSGQPILYVAVNETSEPVASPNPCDAGASPMDDAAALDATSNADAASAELGCTGSGGTVAIASCCATSGPYPDLCTTSTCSCEASTQDTLICQCPANTCFSSSQEKCVSDQ